MNKDNKGKNFKKRVFENHKSLRGYAKFKKNVNGDLTAEQRQQNGQKRRQPKKKLNAELSTSTP